ncbi:MAG: peptidoglycan-binding protein [Ilumatobacteraceae bacterium]
MTPGQRGESVRDLQRRLAAAGFPSGSTAQVGTFCVATAEALMRFQRVRGLRVTSVCDEETWRALVEASWKLGDRLLVHTSPNLRGDDIAELQGLLARLGFDCGRVDGIFGPLTARALADFQSNCGLASDGVCGGETVRALSRVIAHTGSGPGVAAVRERERLRHAPASLTDLRVVVGQFGGLSTISRVVSRDLRTAGAHVMTLDEPDPVAQAITANQFVAQLYIGFEAGTGDESVIHHYQVPSFESIGGRTLSHCLTAALRAGGVSVAEPAGMRLPVLRETKMPAVVCAMSPVRPAVDAADAIAVAVVWSLERWLDLCTLAVD